MEKYSFSKLSAFHTCEYGYKLTYIDHIKGIGNCFASYGTELHSLMERYAKGKIDLWNLVSVYEWEFDAAVPEEFPSMPYCKDMRKLYYDQGLNFLSNFSGYADYKILETEGNFEQQIDDWLFNGIIDLVFEDKDGKLYIQDYKSKGAFKTKKEQAEYARQLYLYALYVKEKYGRFPDTLRFMLLRKNQAIDIPFSEDDFNEALSWAKNTVKEIRECKDFSPTCDEFFSEQLCNHREHCENKNAFLYSGELPNFQSKNWINYVLAGQRNIKEYEYNGAPYYKVTQEAQNQINDYYRGKLYIYKDGYDHKASSILKAMEDTTRKYGCKLHIVDNLTSVNLEASEQNKFQKQEEFVTQLIDFAKKFNVTVVLVVHPHKIETMRRLSKMDIQGISAIIDLAHRILSLYRVSDADKRGEPKRNGKGWFKEPIHYDVLCDILKDRLLGHEGSTAGLYYDKPSRRFFTDEESLDRIYKWDKETYDTPLPYPPPQFHSEADEEVYGYIEDEE